MAIIAKKPESTYTPCPEGLHHAVCVDVIDLGIVPSTFGDKHKVRIVWQIEDENAETRRRFEARKQYNLSLHEKATLRKDLEAWRGRKFSDEELKGFDLEKLLTVNCQIQVVQDLSEDGSIYANIQAVVPAPKNVPKLVPLDYTRQKDRPTTQRNAGAALKSDLDDEVPF
jgi:hypothetical protein